MRLSKSLFRKINLYTIIAVYLLILVGGIVRSVGAGMGCPDWPKCFGAYVPPTSEDQLPENYLEIFKQQRIEKNERLASLLTGLGYDQLAGELKSNPKILKEERFSATKAWVEYINRLIGVLIGFFILGTAVTSFSYRKDKPLIPLIAVLSLILVLFQGWVGSLVVSTNLLPGFISVHMSLALLLVALLILIYHKSNPHNLQAGKTLKVSVVLLFVLMLPQIFMGTQVRESIDLLNASGILRSEWISNIDWVFYLHRSFSLLLMGLTGFIGYRFYRMKALNHVAGWVIIAICAIVLLEVIGGALMAYFHVPSFIQPVHLLFGAMLFGLLFYLTLLVKTSPR